LSFSYSSQIKEEISLNLLKALREIIEMNNQNSSDSEQTKLCFIAIAKLSLINPAGTDKYAYALREIID
jgi:hypothetical protein